GVAGPQVPSGCWLLRKRLRLVPPTRPLPKISCGAPPSFSKYVEALSSAELLTFGPRLTGACHPKSSWTCVRYDAQMSWPPWPPVRSLAKNSQCSSRDSAGTNSMAPVLTVAPRFTGVPQASSVDARWETQMSLLPCPPGLFE